MNMKEVEIPFKIKDSIDQTLISEIKIGLENGIQYFIIGDSSEKTEGFENGSKLSNIKYNLKKITETFKIKLAIKNTSEDLEFYQKLIKDLPFIDFYLDYESAKRSNTHSIEEWEQLLKYTEKH